MGEETRDAKHQLELAQRTIEYSMAVMIPTLLAIMMYAYVLFNELFLPTFALVIVAAVLMIVPALKALRLHYECWSKNAMPQRFMTGMVGVIYISTASVFSVSMVSEYKGLSPEQPLTFAIVGGFLIALIGIMTYNSKNKGRFEKMEIRFYRRAISAVEGTVTEFLDTRAERYDRTEKGRRTILVFDDGKVIVNMASQPGNSTEVIIECSDPGYLEMCDALKRDLDRTSS